MIKLHDLVKLVKHFNIKFLMKLNTLKTTKTHILSLLKLNLLTQTTLFSQYYINLIININLIWPYFSLNKNLKNQYKIWSINNTLFFKKNLNLNKTPLLVTNHYNKSINYILKWQLNSIYINFNTNHIIKKNKYNFMTSHNINFLINYFSFYININFFNFFFSKKIYFKLVNTSITLKKKLVLPKILNNFQQLNFKHI